MDEYYNNENCFRLSFLSWQRLKSILIPNMDKEGQDISLHILCLELVSTEYFGKIYQNHSCAHF